MVDRGLDEHLVVGVGGAGAPGNQGHGTASAVVTGFQSQGRGWLDGGLITPPAPR
ncbi:hypothetical protein QJS66_07445 [Kocuria rhizophila]|nr:hypothetical protein QJS66_07445 [Kocuria rhizophila]